MKTEHPTNPDPSVIHIPMQTRPVTMFLSFLSALWCSLSILGGGMLLSGSEVVLESTVLVVFCWFYVAAHPLLITLALVASKLEKPRLSAGLILPE